MRPFDSYWTRYWKSKEPVKSCPVCEDTGIVSAAVDIHDNSLKVMPCPMKCKSVKIEKHNE
jgi:hypothetical protein